MQSCLVSLTFQSLTCSTEMPGSSIVLGRLELQADSVVFMFWILALKTNIYIYFNFFK